MRQRILHLKLLQKLLHKCLKKNCLLLFPLRSPASKDHLENQTLFCTFRATYLTTMMTMMMMVATGQASPPSDRTVTSNFQLTTFKSDRVNPSRSPPSLTVPPPGHSRRPYTQTEGWGFDYLRTILQRK